jgi:hypothetical protein
VLAYNTSQGSRVPTLKLNFRRRPVISAWVTILIAILTSGLILICSLGMFGHIHALHLPDEPPKRYLITKDLRDPPKIHGMWPTWLSESAEPLPPLLRSPLLDKDRYDSNHNDGEWEGDQASAFMISTHEVPKDLVGKFVDSRQSFAPQLPSELNYTAKSTPGVADTLESTLSSIRSVDGTQMYRTPRGPIVVPGVTPSASSSPPVDSAAAAAAARRRRKVPDLLVLRESRSPSPIVWSNPLPSLLRFIGTPYSSSAAAAGAGAQRRFVGPSLTSEETHGSLFSDNRTPARSDASLFLPGHPQPIILETETGDVRAGGGGAYEVTSTWVFENVLDNWLTPQKSARPSGRAGENRTEEQSLADHGRTNAVI